VLACRGGHERSVCGSGAIGAAPLTGRAGGIDWLLRLTGGAGDLLGAGESSEFSPVVGRGRVLDGDKGGELLRAASDGGTDDRPCKLSGG
jgi:hypothetical protein